MIHRFFVLLQVNTNELNLPEHSTLAHAHAHANGFHQFFSISLKQRNCIVEINELIKDIITMCLRTVAVTDNTQQNLYQFTPFYLAFSLFVKLRQCSKNPAGSSEGRFIKKKIRSALSLSFCAS